MMFPFLVVIRPDCIARAVMEHMGEERNARDKPEAAARNAVEGPGEDLRPQAGPCVERPMCYRSAS